MEIVIAKAIRNVANSRLMLGRMPQQGFGCGRRVNWCLDKTGGLKP